MCVLHALTHSLEFARIPVLASLDDNCDLAGQFFLKDSIKVLCRDLVVVGQGYPVDRLELVVDLQSGVFEHAVGFDCSDAQAPPPPDLQAEIFRGGSRVGFQNSGLEDSVEAVFVPGLDGYKCSIVAAVDAAAAVLTAADFVDELRTALRIVTRSYLLAIDLRDDVSHGDSRQRRVALDGCDCDGVFVLVLSDG